MPEENRELSLTDIECCPQMVRKSLCDVLDFRYRLPRTVRVPGQRVAVPVELLLHFRFTRCSGALVIGDPVYSTTLLPGERVRLFTSDRHNRWSFDSSSNLSYRHETTSEESFYSAGFARSMTDLTVSEAGFASSSFEESWAEGGGGASVNLLGIIKIGGGGGGGSYDASATSMFARSLSRHAEAASAYVAAGVRAKSSVSVGEVERRSHAEGESEAHYESSSREFRNDNHCHAVTYLFRRINKLQVVKFELVAIERRIEDPVAPTGAFQRVVPDMTGKVVVKPVAISAASEKRLELERAARTSAAETQRAVSLKALSGDAPLRVAVDTVQPIDARLRARALRVVDEELVREGLLDEVGGKVSERLVAELSWKREEALPTPGIIVKGCLDTCETCEPARKREIETELKRKELENELLKRQIELLDKAQEYRCCPVGEAEAPEA
ncbi:MAG TPA: hypothetical protein VLB27_08010 [candidate division Zixibacteria bacterium]|nr:hypothetical protein [candidate division Zixibacteria bacterium]